MTNAVLEVSMMYFEILDSKDSWFSQNLEANQETQERDDMCSGH